MSKKIQAKLITLAMMLLIVTITAYMNENRSLENDEVKLIKCVDGDTAWFEINEVKTKVRFLAIDTPESTNKIEKYGKEASDYTCTELNNANSIKLEYESFNKIDKYNRTLAYIIVDNELLQEKLVKKGYAKVYYADENYKYYNSLMASEELAKSNRINIWS